MPRIDDQMFTLEPLSENVSFVNICIDIFCLIITNKYYANSTIGNITSQDSVYKSS